MAFTEAQILRISADRKAVNNKIYTDNKNNKYKGNIDGRLVKVFLSDKEVGVRLNIEDTPESLNTYLKELNTELESIVLDISSLQTFEDFVIEFLDSFTYAQKEGYKVFNYTGDNITEILVYADNTLAELLYTVTLTYTGDNLTTKEIVKTDGSYTLTKTFSYDINGNITTIETI